MCRRIYDRKDPYFYDKPTVYMARSFAYVFAIATFFAVFLGYHRQIPGQVREVEAQNVQPYTFNYDGGEGLIVVAKLRVEEVPQAKNGKNAIAIRVIAEVPLSLLSSGWHIHTIRERDDNPVQPERIIPESPPNLQVNQRQLALRNTAGIQRGESFVAVVYLKPIKGWRSADKEMPSSAEEVLEGFKSGLYSVTIQPVEN